MAKRPLLNDNSFLGHLFSPKKNPLPTGVRKTQVTASKGRSKARIAAYNRMSPTSQEVLRRSGKRDAYLKGESTLGDAKKSLRAKAVSLGLAKPTRASKPARIVSGRSALDARVKAHLKQTLRDSGYNVNPYTIDEMVPFIDDSVIADVPRWDVAKIRAAGRPGSEYEDYIDGQKRNGFWYK